MTVRGEYMSTLGPRSWPKLTEAKRTSPSLGAVDIGTGRIGCEGDGSD